MLVVVGGHSRNIGKTSVVAGLIAALPKRNWTAMKITQYGNDVCSSEGEPCDCAAEPDHPYALSEETGAGCTDSARFLAAGARRSFWLRTAGGQLGNALPAFRRILGESENMIVESNSILQFVRPEVYLAVMDFSKEDFKPSSLRFLDRAHAIIIVDTGINVPLWKGVATSLWSRKKQFYVAPPHYVTEAIAEFVDSRLSAAEARKEAALKR